MEELTPTLNTTIESYSGEHGTAAVSAPKAAKVQYTPVTPACDACPMPMQDNAETAGMAFALGAIVGIVLVLAFSKQSTVELDA